MYGKEVVVSPATDNKAAAVTVADVCVDDGGSLQISLFKLFKLLLLLVVTILPPPLDGDEEV